MVHAPFRFEDSNLAEILFPNSAMREDLLDYTYEWSTDSDVSDPDHDDDASQDFTEDEQSPLWTPTDHAERCWDDITPQRIQRLIDDSDASDDTRCFHTIALTSCGEGNLKPCDLPIIVSQSSDDESDVHVFVPDCCCVSMVDCEDDMLTVTMTLVTDHVHNFSDRRLLLDHGPIDIGCSDVVTVEYYDSCSPPPKRQRIGEPL